MVRGRHRGLPNAIDRAVMLPTEFKKILQIDGDEEEIPIDGTAQNGVAEHEHTAIAEEPNMRDEDEGPASGG